MMSPMRRGKAAFCAVASTLCVMALMSVTDRPAEVVRELIRADAVVPEDGPTDREWAEMATEEAAEHSGKFTLIVYGAHDGLYPELKTAHNMAAVEVDGSTSVKELKDKLSSMSNLELDDMLLENPRSIHHDRKALPLEPDYRTLSSVGVPGRNPEYWKDGTLTLTLSRKGGADDEKDAASFASLHSVEEITPSAMKALGPVSEPLTNTMKTASQMRSMGNLKDAQDMELQAVNAANQVLADADVDWEKIHKEYYGQIRNSQMQAEADQYRRSARHMAGKTKAEDLSLDDLMIAQGGDAAMSVYKAHQKQDEAQDALEKSQQRLQEIDSDVPTSYQHIDPNAGPTEEDVDGY